MSIVASHWKLTTTNWEQLSKLILLQIHKKLPKILTLTILWSFSIWIKLDSWKRSVSGCFMNWLLIKKKIIILKYHLLLFYTTTTNHLSIGLWNDSKNGFYTKTVDDLWLDWKEAPKHFPKPNLQEKNVMVTVWSSAAGLIHYSFLNPSETI